MKSIKYSFIKLSPFKMLGPITWLPGLKRLNVLKADDIVIVLFFIILKMSEANFNVNLPSSESDDDMSSTGITEKELVAIENEVMPETTRRSTKYGMNKTVDWFADKKIDLACGQFTCQQN